MTIKNRPIILLPLLMSLACTRVIQIPTTGVAGAMDIEANITGLDTLQKIILRKSVAFAKSSDYPAVSGASVSVTDEAGSLFPFSETTAGVYTNSSLKGLAGTTYRLQVIAEGQGYSATSTLPKLVIMDSVTDKNRPLNRSKDGQDEKVVSVYYQDPPGIANQYRFIEWVNGVQVKSIFTNDDQLNDGRYVTLDLLEQDIDIYVGDTVKVEMQCVDKLIYTYWFALQSQQANNFSGSVAPANPPTNISPAVLGYFSAHTSQIISLIVK